MNIHEYQARELFKKFKVASQRGAVAATPEEAEHVARALQEHLGLCELVVKAQIHAGGRGKGTFKNGFQGGVHVCETPSEVRDLAAQMLGQVLVTHQTGPVGKEVSKVFVGEAVEIDRELYVAILLDRKTSVPVLIASTEGGVDIEQVAEKTPEKIFRMSLDPALGLMPWQARKVAVKLGLEGHLVLEAAKLLTHLYQLFVECDCSQVEINPLVVTKAGSSDVKPSILARLSTSALRAKWAEKANAPAQLLALDAKFNFDDNALYRQPNIVAMRDITEEDPREVEASKVGLSYIGLDGNIACLVNGAGLAMATMDIIQYAGGRPANFLDVGGGASQDQVAAAFRIILADPQVKGILVNIFGGIMDCNVIAQGIVKAAQEAAVSIPLVVRLEGNNVAAGKKTLEESGLALVSATDILDAAKKVVQAVEAVA